MSKASEWAAGYGKRPSFSLTTSAITAEVTNDGKLFIGQVQFQVSPPFTMGPEDALLFSDWIRHTFGEQP